MAELINKKQIEIEELQKQIKLKNKDIKNIEIKLSNLLKNIEKVLIKNCIRRKCIKIIR